MSLEIAKKNYERDLDEEMNFAFEIKCWVFIVFTILVSIWLIFFAGHLLMNC